jgi:hypothetical protein
MHATFPAHLILDVINLMTFGEGYYETPSVYIISSGWETKHQTRYILTYAIRHYVQSISNQCFWQ